MPQSKLVKEITLYGDKYQRVSDVLFYSSERTVEQYKKMRMYPMCWMGLNFIKLGLPDAPFTVECDEDENIRLITEKLLKKFWKRLIRDALESLDFGFKANEIRYEYGTLNYKDKNDDNAVFEGLLLRRPKGLDGETIDILVNEPLGDLKGFRQNDTIDVFTKDKKALLFTNNLESGNYYGISSQEPIYPSWYDANINRQFHMRWLERKGTGIFIGIYPKGKSVVDGVEKDNQDIMLDLLDGIMEGTAVSLPSGRDENGNLQWDISLLDSDDKTDPFIERAKYLDETILRGLIIPEKALTQGEVGARASTEAFQDLFVTRKQDVLDQTVDTIDRYLLPSFIEPNFGKDIEVHVKAGKLDDESKFTAGEIVKKLIEGGKEIIEQQWLIDKTGIPLEERPEIIEEIPEEIIEEEEYEEEEYDEDGNLIEDYEVKEEKFAQNRWRALTKREDSFKMNQLDSHLDVSSIEFQSAMSEELNRQAERIKGFVSKNFGTDKPVNIANKIEIKKAPIKKILRDYLDNIYIYSYSNFKSTVEGGVKLAVTTDTAKGYIGFRAGLTSDKIANDLSATIKYRVANNLTDNVGKVEVLNNILVAVMDYIDSRISNIAETELGFTLEKANTDYYIINKKAITQGLLPTEKAIKRFQLSAILDDNTCDLCFKLDLTIVDAESPVMSQYSTPIHFNCRCAWLPITQGEIDDPRFLDTGYSFDGKQMDKSISIKDVNASVGKDIKLRTFSEGIYNG